jgi:hypothetical protein
MTMPYLINAIGWKNSYVIMHSHYCLAYPCTSIFLALKKRSHGKERYQHFIPAIAFLFATYLNLSHLAELYPESKTIPVEGLSRPTTLAILVVRSGLQFTYYFLSRKALNSYQRSIQNLFSETSRIDLQWARYLCQRLYYSDLYIPYSLSTRACVS